MTQPSGNSYIVGKGKLYFDMFAPGTKTPQGERYFGNTPSFSATSAKTSLDHFSAEGGIAVKDSAVDITINRSGKFQTDNVVKENIALFWLGDSSSVVQTAQTGASETITVSKLGLYYQLGRTATTPSGVRKITNVTVKKGATPVTLTGNVEVDLTRARLFIEPDAAGIAAGDVLTVTYDIQASTRDQAISKNQSIYGSLRFIADNPVGEDIDYFFPYVKLSPEGDFALKGDKWMEMSFSMDILVLDSNTAAVYADGVPQ